MTTQESAETLGEAAEHYTLGLFTAVIATGSPARVSIGQYAPDDPRAQVGPHTRWPFLLLRLGGTEVHIYCVPTSTGFVLILETPDGLSWCLPTWGCTRHRVRRCGGGRGPRITTQSSTQLHVTRGIPVKHVLPAIHKATGKPGTHPTEEHHDHPLPRHHQRQLHRRPQRRDRREVLPRRRS